MVVARSTPAPQGEDPVEPDLDRLAIRVELQEMVDSVRAARVFATLGDWAGLRRALDANLRAAEHVRSLLDGEIG